jgi:hypothetical protein
LVLARQFAISASLIAAIETVGIEVVQDLQCLQWLQCHRFPSLAG